MKINQTFIIATHQMVYGSPQALRDYLNNKKIKQLLFIGLSFLTQNTSSRYLYKNGQEINREIIDRSKNIGIKDYIVDFFQILLWVFKEKDKYDTFIGVNNLNCLAGLFLKKIGKVKKVIYYSIDFVPIRFRNRLLNYIFHRIEIICVKYADEVWDLSPRIAKGRKIFLRIPNYKNKQKIIPVGVWNDKVKKLPFSKIKKHQLLFVGHLLEKQGVQLVLDSIPKILKDIPNFQFLIIGGGEYKYDLEKRVKELHIEDHVEFRGWVNDRDVLDNILSESACAVATYKPEKQKLYNFTYYTDPTKLKDYLSAGLPIVLTDVSHNALEIQEQKCGIIVDYETKSVAETIVKLMGDSKKLQEYRKNAISMANRYEWSNIFDKALKHE